MAISVMAAELRQFLISNMADGGHLEICRKSYLAQSWTLDWKDYAYLHIKFGKVVLTTGFDTVQL